MAVSHANLGQFVNNSYQDLSALLARLNIPLAVAEAHGLCCGLLCSLSSAAAKTRWFTELLDAASLSANQVSHNAAELKALDEWFGRTLSALNDSDLEFSPLLPDDLFPVKERIVALKDFCAGYTYGIGIALSSRGHTPLPPDTQEIIEDFQAIETAETVFEAHAPDPEKSLSSTTASNTEEEVYNELLEYVRVGVLLILEELRPVSPVVQEKLS